MMCIARIKKLTKFCLEVKNLCGLDKAQSPVSRKVLTDAGECILVSLGDGMGTPDAVVALSSRHGRKDG